MAINMGSAIAYLELDTSKFSKGFTSAYNDLKVFGDKSSTAEQKFKGFSSALNTVGSGLAKSVTLPLVGVGTAALKAGTDFESAMSQVAATMGKPKSEIQDLTNFAKKMGATTVFSAKQAAEGLNILAQSGLDANEQMEALPEVLNLAAAGNLSLADSATYVVGTLKGFGKGMDEAQRVTDLVAKGATMANTDVRGLGTALSSSSATAKSYGQNMDSVTLSLLRLAEQNVTGEEAATALNRAMMDLYTPTTSAKKALDELGISVYDSSGKARDFNDIVDDLNSVLSGMSEEQQNAYKNTIFTTYGLQAFNKMTVSSTEKVNDFKNGLKDANDSALKQAKTQLDNLKGDITLFKSALEGAGIVISNVLIPNIRNFIQWLTNLVTKFNELSEGQQNFIVKAGLIAASIAPILLIFSKVITVISKVSGVIKFLLVAIQPVTAAVLQLKAGMTVAELAMEGFPAIALKIASAISFLVSPIGLVIAGITALVAAFVIAYKKSETFRNFINNLVNDLKTFFTETVPQAFEMFKEKVSEVFENAKQKIGEFKDKCKEAVQNVIEFFTVTLPQGIEQFATVTVPSFVQSVITFLQELPHNIGIIVGEMLGHLYLFATNAIEWATTAIPEFINSVVTFFQELPNKVWEWLVNTYNKITEWGSNMIQKGMEVGSNFLQTVGEFFSQLPSTIWNFLAQTFQKVVAWGSQMVSNGRAAISSFVSTVVGIITSLPAKVWGILSQIPAKVRQLGSQLRSAGAAAFNALWDGIKSVGDSILGWVSGFASTIKSFISGIVEGFNNVVGSANSAKSAAASVKGRHANGLDYVPYNGYIAELHKGERVLTAQENKEYNEGRRGQGGDTFNFYNTQPNPYEYARQMKKAKKELLYGI
nr:MAG TPA: minor tail protein [Caudoviricetes sp.]